MTPIFDRIAWELDMHVNEADPVRRLFSRHGHYPYVGWPCEWRP